MTEHHADFVSAIRPILDIKTLALRDIPLSTIINTTKRILQEIESLKSDYVRTTLKSECSPPQETAAFHLEYGTIPKLNTLSAKQREFYYDYNYAVLDATEKAIEWFPHNAPEMEEMPEDWLPDPPSMHRQWSMIDIHVLFNQPCAPDAILLEFNRFTGCHVAANWIFSYVTNRLTEELQYEARRAYLQLIEGCDAERNPITRYLFDELICRDVCSHWQPNIIVRVGFT